MLNMPFPVAGGGESRLKKELRFLIWQFWWLVLLRRHPAVNQPKCTVEGPVSGPACFAHSADDLVWSRAAPREVQRVHPRPGRAASSEPGQPRPRHRHRPPRPGTASHALARRHGLTPDHDSKIMEVHWTISFHHETFNPWRLLFYCRICIAMGF